MRPSAIGAVPAGIRALKASCQAYHPSASTSANKDDGKATLQTGQLVVTRRAQLASLVAMGGSAFGFASVLAQPGPALATEGSPVEQALQGIKRDFVEGQYYVTGGLLGVLSHAAAEGACCRRVSMGGENTFHVTAPGAVSVLPLVLLHSVMIKPSKFLDGHRHRRALILRCMPVMAGRACREHHSRPVRSQLCLQGPDRDGHR